MGKEYVLITGASSGIGAESAIFLSKSYNIILNGRNKERLNTVKDKCSTGEHIIWDFDLLQINALEASLADFIKTHQICVSKFVHCAGMMKNIPLKMLSVDILSQTYNVNVISAAIIMKILTSKKYNNKSLNNAVLISSNISGFGAKAHSAYGASKAALDGLMHSLAMELSPSVRVNSVLPGGIETPLTSRIFEDETLVKKMADSYPLGLGSTLDIAKAVGFLLSDESRWITGQQLVVDGGRTVNLTV